MEDNTKRLLGALPSVAQKSTLWCIFTTYFDITYLFPFCFYLVFEEVGKKHSQILEEQRQNGGLLGGGLRYPMDQLVIFWVQCEQKTLDQRCDKRVDQMIAEGLLGEMQVFHEV